MIPPANLLVSAQQQAINYPRRLNQTEPERPLEIFPGDNLPVPELNTVLNNRVLNNCSVCAVIVRSKIVLKPRC